jgi:hypothetical protein
MLKIVLGIIDLTRHDEDQKRTQTGLKNSNFCNERIKENELKRLHGIRSRANTPMH